MYTEASNWKNNDADFAVETSELSKQQILNKLQPQCLHSQYIKVIRPTITSISNWVDKPGGGKLNFPFS